MTGLVLDVVASIVLLWLGAAVQRWHTRDHRAYLATKETELVARESALHETRASNKAAFEAMATRIVADLKADGTRATVSPIRRNQPMRRGRA